MPLVADGAATSELPTLVLQADGVPQGHDSDDVRQALDDDRRRMQDLIGRQFHIYQIETLLGRGGMGWVFLAQHRDLQRSCALKIVSPRVALRDPDYLDRFLTEGQAAASLVHPNVVTVHAIGAHEALHFLEMEFVRGRSLQARIADGPLPPLQATAIAAQVAAGLAAAHQAGILHRDLKPDNILMTHQGIPKLSDFGLAKRLASKEADETLAGTPHYMAPELFVGQPPTPAADVYALGVCLYAMLTGRLPFHCARLNDLIAAASGSPLPHLRAEHPHLPLEISEAVLAMLSRSPANRPRDGVEAGQLLNAVLGQARDIEVLLHEALDGVPTIAWRAEGDRHLAVVDLADNRRQKVFIETTPASDGERLLSIYSVCGAVDETHSTDALRLNARIVHGAVAIRELDGRPHFVVINNYPRATVDAEEILQSVLDAALHADALEQRLTGGDVH